MSSIRVSWMTANSMTGSCDAHRMELSGVLGTVRSMKSYRCMSGRQFDAIYKSMDRLISRLEDEKTGVRNLGNGLQDLMKVYNDYENRISENVETKEKVKPFDVSTGDLLKAVSSFGILGNVIAAFGYGATGNWSDSAVIKSGKELLKAIGGGATAVSEGTSTGWKNAIFGTADAFSKLNTTNAGTTFASSMEKSLIKDLSFSEATTTGAKVKVLTKWGGYVLTGVSNFLENQKEFEGIEGSEGRMAAETVIETGTDIVVGAVATAAVSAGLVALGATAAPAVVVGLGAAAVAWAANGVCEALTGKDIGEQVADTLCDAGEAIAAKWGTFTRWGKSVFGFG